MAELAVGLDIGGTKCAVSLGRRNGDSLAILHREEFPTKGLTWQETLGEFAVRLDALDALKGRADFAIGISCGGPLDSRAGVVLSPPNLPGWDNVPVVRYFEERFHVPVCLQNDANACAYAEWKFGAGRDTRNMVFMTFGTGLGAGMVLDGRLYTGANDNAGEIGHIRLESAGPLGYGKEGSAEGFCSGAGIARLATMRARELTAVTGKSAATSATITKALKGELTARELFAAVRANDAFCTSVFRESARHLATILAYTIDIVNPERIVLGGVYMRNVDLFEPVIMPLIADEALPGARAACRIVPAGLGENVGDYAALAVAIQ